jgi:hypothetical protein
MALKAKSPRTALNRPVRIATSWLENRLRNYGGSSEKIGEASRSAAS